MKKMKTGGTKKYQSGGSSMYTNTTKGEMPNYPPMKKGGSTKKMQAGGMRKASIMNPTSRNTAMTALGVKKQSNAYSPSRFSDNVISTTKSTKMKKGGTKKR